MRLFPGRGASRSGLVLGLAILGLTACSSPNRHVFQIERDPEGEARSAEAASGRPARTVAPRLPVDPQAENPVLARFDGGELRLSDLGRELLRTRPEEGVGLTTRLIGLAILEREAAAEGLTCPEAWLRQRAEVLEQDLEREAALAFGVGTTPAQYVRAAFQRDLATHRRLSLEKERERWLFERVVRLESLEEGRVGISVIATKERAEADDALQRLSAGADFGRLAARVSVLGDTAPGGRLGLLPASALHPAVAARIARLEVGDRSGVLNLDQEGAAARYWIVRLDHRELPRSGGWSALAPVVEEDLTRHPVTADEWAGWYRRMEQLYEVRLSAIFERP